MGHVIWKLSALATVVGLGLVGVVYQQRGFGKPSGALTAIVAGTSAPQPKVKGTKAVQGPTPPSEAADSIAGTDSETVPSLASAPPEDPTAESFFPEVAGADSEFAEAETKNPQPGAVRRGDPDHLEGAGESAPPNGLTEEDPFQKSRQPSTAARTIPRGNSARATTSPARPGINEPDDDVLSQPRTRGLKSSAQVADTSLDQRPSGAGKSQRRSRPKLLEDGEPPAPVAAEVVEQIAAEPQYGAANPFQSDAPPLSQTAAGKKRNQLTDDDEFIQGDAAPGPESAPTRNRQGPGTRARVQDFADEETRQVEQPAALQRDGSQPIPKLNRDTAPTDQEMPPPVAQGGRQRPNSLLDDGDEGPATPRSTVPGVSSDHSDSFETGSRGREPDSRLTDSATSIPSQRRPSRHVLEIEPNAPVSGDFGQRQPEAAASLKSATEVIAVPQRLASNTEFPGISTASRGRPRVTIEKRAPATAYIGQPLIYHIVIRNVGNGVARQVVVEDIVPDGVAMQGSIPQAELVTKKLTWKIGNLAVGEERKISVKVVPGAEGAVGSAATVNFLADPAQYASTAEPDSGVPATPVSSPAGGALQLTNGASAVNRDSSGVTLDIEGPKQVGVGQPFDVRFRLTNRTNQPAAGILIRTMLPGGLQHQRRIQDLEYQVGTLAPAESRDVTMTLTPVQPGRAVSRVMVMAADGRVLQSQEFSTDAGAIGNQSNSADLPVTLERLGNIRPAVNRATAYANRLTNRGPLAVSHLRVTEIIPQGMEFVSAGDEGQYDAATRRVVWNVSRLESKAATDLEISLIAKVTTPQANSVVVADRAGNQVQASAQISAGGAPLLTVEVLPPRGPVQVGDPVVYEIRLANRGTEVVQQAAVRLSVPDELRLTKAGPLNFQQQGADVVFDAIPALDPGRQALLTAEFVAQAPGATRLKVQFVGSHMTIPVSRDENLQIAAK